MMSELKTYQSARCVTLRDSLAKFNWEDVLNRAIFWNYGCGVANERKVHNFLDCGRLERNASRFDLLGGHYWFKF